MRQTELIDKLKALKSSLMDDGIFGLYALSFPNSCLGMPSGVIDLKEKYFTLNTRRFGTAKRLGQETTLKEGYFNQSIFGSFNLLIPIQYILTFGSAKPTGAKPSRRVGFLAHQKDRLWN